MTMYGKGEGLRVDLKVDLWEASDLRLTADLASVLGSVEAR